MSGDRRSTHQRDRSGRAWLTAWVRDLALAFPLDRVREVLLWIPWQPAPPDRPGLVGILPVRGEAWPVWDLSREWGWSPRRPDPETGYILVSNPDGSLGAAFLVDRTGWVLAGDAAAIDRDSAAKTGPVPIGSYRFNFTVTDSESEMEHFVIDIDESLSRLAQ